MSKVTEQYVLDNCIGASLDALENVLFPQFQAQLDKHSSPKCIPCLVQPIRAVIPTTFEEWRGVHYKELRRAAYGDWHEQMEMIVDGTHEQHVQAVKAAIPKGAI